MKRRKQKRSIFENIVITFAVIVTLFIFTAIMSIVFKGVPYMGEAFKSEEVKFAVNLSLKTSLLSTLLCLFFAIPTAYALTKTDMKLRKLANIIIEVPISIPNVMIGLSLLIMFSSVPGKFLSRHGISMIFNVKGIVLAQMMVNLPIVIRVIRTAFMNIDSRYQVIAGSLGATPFTTFVRIILPLARNSIISAGIIAWSRGLGEFGATLMFVGATRMKTETIPTSIFLNMATGDTGPAMACAMILLIISALSLFLTNFFNKVPGDTRGDSQGENSKSIYRMVGGN